MSDIQFDNNYAGVNQADSSDVPGLAGFLISKGIAKNRKSAELMMIIFAVAGILFSFIQIIKQL
jgi:uncharacterized protein YgiB involved in biofilm formation